MGCRCGKAIQSEMVKPYNSYPTVSGMYPLASYSECTTLYTYGPHAGTSVYVVARLMPEERLFRRDQLAEASSYSREVVGANVENIPTAALCAEAVTAVYG